MKTKTLIAALLLFSSSFVARAHLIDLTPGGFDLTSPLPVAVQKFFSLYGPGGQENLAGANIVNGVPLWSPFTPFGPVQFSIGPQGANDSTGWNLTGTGFLLNFVLVEDGSFAHLFKVSGRERFTGAGTVNIDGIIPPDAITFAGRSLSRVPDSGSTLMLMGIASVALLWAARHRLLT